MLSYYSPPTVYSRIAAATWRNLTSVTSVRMIELLFYPFHRKDAKNAQKNKASHPPLRISAQPLRSLR